MTDLLLRADIRGRLRGPVRLRGFKGRRMGEQHKRYHRHDPCFPVPKGDNKQSHCRFNGRPDPDQLLLLPGGDTASFGGDIYVSSESYAVADFTTLP